MGIFLLAIMGDCGTPWPGWWRRFLKWPTPPPPEPPWWWVEHLVAAGGGVLGGTLVERLVQGSLSDPIVLIASLGGAFAVGRFAGGLTASVLNTFGAREEVGAKVLA
jgi:hypothetical protein